MSVHVRSAVVLAVSALAFAAIDGRPAAAQETEERAPLRGAEPVVDETSSVASPSESDERESPRLDRRPRPRPVTTTLVQAPLRGPIQGGVDKPVEQPVYALPPPEIELAPPRRRRPRFEEDPYAPLGWRVGGMTYFSAIEAGIGYDSNPNRLDGPSRGSPLLRTEGELKFQSDWLVHEFKGDLRGAYNTYPEAKDANRPEADGLVAFRLDVSRDTEIDLEGRLRIDTERPGSVNLPVRGVARPINTAVGASTGVTQHFNRLAVSLRGSVDHFTYEDVRLADGSIFDQSDRDFTQYALTWRTAYELKPGVIPFVETQIDTRKYVRAIDDFGFTRDSNGLAVRAGSTVEFTRLLTGELSAGYGLRRYEDRRLEDLQGPLIDAALIWSATPLTTVRFRAATQLGETIAPGANGVFGRTATIEVEHALRRNVTLIGAASFYENDYRGIDIEEQGFVGSVKVDYKLTRSLVMQASFTHERLDSSAIGSDYTANVYLVGLRLQR